MNLKEYPRERRMDSEDCGGGLPYKVVNYSREMKKGVTAKSLEDFIKRAKEKMDLSGDDQVKIVLEQDGTEVDDEEYFRTLEGNTSLMLLLKDQRWLPPGKLPNYRIVVDDPDGPNEGIRRELENLVHRLHQDLCHLSMLGGKELEILSDMEPESLTDIVPDKAFLEQLKEASARFLDEKRQAQEAMELLKLYKASQEKKVSNSAAEKV